MTTLSNCVLVDVPMIISPSVSYLLITTSVVPTLMTPPTIVLSNFLELVGAGDSDSGTNLGGSPLMPLPDMSTFVAKNCGMHLDVFEDRIVDFLFGPALMELAYQILKFVVPPNPSDMAVYKDTVSMV